MRKIVFAILGFTLFMLSAFLLFEPSGNPTGLFVYTPSLAIININNNVKVGDTLNIEFMTKGTKDLMFKTEGLNLLDLTCNGKSFGKK